MFVSLGESFCQGTHETPSDRDLEGMRDRLGRHVASAMENIAAINQMCKENCSSDIKHFLHGFWYGEDFSAALKAKGTKNALAWNDSLRNGGDLLLGRFPSKFFTPVEGPHEREFILSTGCKPSDAVVASKTGFDTVKQGFVIGDCGEMVILARYTGLLTFLEEVNGSAGIEKFDRLFSPPHGDPMNMIFSDTPRQPMRYFIQFTKEAIEATNEALGIIPVTGLPVGTIDNRPVQVGQSLCLNGVPKYKAKRPFGVCGVFNVICNNSTPGSQTYTGLGLASGGVSEMGICLKMAEEHNIPALDQFSIIPDNKMLEARLTCMLSGSSALINDRVETTPEALPKVVVGYDWGSPQDFSTRLIYDIVQAPIENISIDFVKKHPHAAKAGIDYIDTASKDQVVSLSSALAELKMN